MRRVFIEKRCDLSSYWIFRFTFFARRIYLRHFQQVFAALALALKLLELVVLRMSSDFSRNNQFIVYQVRRKWLLLAYFVKHWLARVAWQHRTFSRSLAVLYQTQNKDRVNGSPEFFVQVNNVHVLFKVVTRNVVAEVASNPGVLQSLFYSVPLTGLWVTQFFQQTSGVLAELVELVAKVQLLEVLSFFNVISVTVTLDPQRVLAC